MKPVEWREVLRAIQDDETRSYAMKCFSDAGFSVVSFSTQRRAREVMADALTRTEDWLDPRRKRERASIRDVRRRLEWELWP